LDLEIAKQWFDLGTQRGTFVGCGGRKQNKLRAKAVAQPDRLFSVLFVFAHNATSQNRSDNAPSKSMYLREETSGDRLRIV
jgi:hypothetical protein